MSTPIRPELSKKNKYYISKHRYYELAHFCKQYPEWQKEKTYKTERKIELVERVAIMTDKELSDYILKAVTEGRPFEYLQTMLEIPCCRDTFYDRYRKFFYILDELKD